MPQDFTSWEAIFSSLRLAFPADAYHSGSTVELISETDRSVSLRVGDQGINAGLLVGADGLRSALRHRIAPETTSRYAGYVAWRGVLDERLVPRWLTPFFDDRFSLCSAPDGGHALCYFIPGDGLAVHKGARRLNWVWYRMTDTGPELDATMTDAQGTLRDAAVPQGEVRRGAVEELHRSASCLAPQFAELILRTPEPFIQAIYDIAPPRMVSGRMCLIGDAAFVVRPHTAAAAAKAAADATNLARSLRASAPDMCRGLELWETQQLATGRRLVNYGVALGQRQKRPAALGSSSAIDP